MGVGVMTTDDCQRTYEELLAKGVTFLLGAGRTSLRDRGDVA